MIQRNVNDRLAQGKCCERLFGEHNTAGEPVSLPRMPPAWSPEVLQRDGTADPLVEQNDTLGPKGLSKNNFPVLRRNVVRIQGTAKGA